MLKSLNYADYIEGIIKIKKEDEETVLENFNEKIEMKYDEVGRVFDEAGTYIADLIKY